MCSIVVCSPGVLYYLPLALLQTILLRNVDHSLENAILRQSFKPICLPHRLISRRNRIVTNSDDEEIGYVTDGRRVSNA